MALIYGREDNFNMIETNEKEILDYNNELNKFENNNNYTNGDSENNLEIYKNDIIEKLCESMRKNNLKEALKITDLIIENNIIMGEIKNRPEKIIRNACRGISIKYLYVLLKLLDFKKNQKNKSILFYYVYVFFLNSWIAELEKNDITFDKKITDDNWYIFEFLLGKEDNEFTYLMNYIEEIPNKYLSKILSIKFLNKIQIPNPQSLIYSQYFGNFIINKNLNIEEVSYFNKLLTKFNANNLSFELFSESSKTTEIDIDFLFSLGKIDYSTFNLNKMIKFCRPSVVLSFINCCKAYNININIKNLINVAIKRKDLIIYIYSI